MTPLTVYDLIQMLSNFDANSEVCIYDDDNDRTLFIAAVDEDEADSKTPPTVLVFCS